MTTRDEIMKKLNAVSEKNPTETQKLKRQFLNTPLGLKVAFMTEVLRSCDCLPKFSTATTKIETKSQEYRRLGNEAYATGTATGDLIALRYYLLSIAYAHDDSEELALAYANRSAVLYRLEKYRLALVDVNRALRSRLPDAIRNKMIERKKKCMHNIKEENSMEIKMAQAHAADLDLDPFLQFMLYSALKKSLEIQADEIENLFEKKPEIPSLLKRNSCFPKLSSKVNVTQDSEKKRRLIANTDIEPGDLLLVERPYATILSPKYAQTHCACCFIRSLTLIPCSSCSKVMFCGQDCREKALLSFHRVECQIMPTLLRLRLEDEDMLALRMVLITTKQGEDLKDLVEYPFFENYEINTEPSSKKKMKKKHNAKNVKKPPSKIKKNFRKPKNEYARVCSLEDGLIVLSREEMVNKFWDRAMVAAILLHVLKSSSYFTKTVQNGLAVQTIPEEIQHLVGNLLLKNLLVLDLNGERIIEWIQSSCSTDYESKYTGRALYPTFSLMNHSCDPNVAKFNHQDCIVVRAVQPIAAGEEIFTCYDQPFGIHPWEKRQEYCKEKFYFECKCDPCKFNWPLYKQLSKRCRVLSNKLDLQSFKEDVIRLRKMRTEKEEIEHFEEFARKFISWAHTNIEKPWKDYYDCLEMYKNSLISKANRYSPEVHPLLEIDI